MTDTKHTPGPADEEMAGCPHEDVGGCRICWRRAIGQREELLEALERLEKAQHPFKRVAGKSQLECADEWQAERMAASEVARAAIARAKGEKP